jgi:hypothetical protein
VKVVLRQLLRTVPWVVIMLTPLVASAERRKLALTLLRTVWRSGSAATETRARERRLCQG